MQLAWYYVEEDCTLTEISTEKALEVIDTQDLQWHVCDWPGAYVDDEGYPVIINGIMGLEGTMV